MATVKKTLNPKKSTGSELFANFLQEVQPKLDRWLDSYLPSEKSSPEKLHRAMRYSIFAGGKRLRPSLALLACEDFGGEEKLVKPAACALEMIHTYSLIHDDLPCMDDDDLRRGKPSSHKAFGEATAILAGDALLTQAFLVLPKIPNASLMAKVTEILAKASGSVGMVGGQQDDLDGTEQTPSAAFAERIHLRKTAALISASLEIGAVCAEVSESVQSQVRHFGTDVGLAFQIVDDILDATSDTATLGKTAGKDAEENKMTYPACMGIKKAKEEAQALIERAIARAENFPASRTDRFVSLSRFVLQRVS